MNYTRSPIPQRAHIPGAQTASADPTANLVADMAGDTDADPTRRLLAAESGHDDGRSDGGVNFDSRAAVRELLATAKPPLGTVARENAETACRWLTEGALKVPRLFTAPCTLIPAGDDASQTLFSDAGRPHSVLNAVC